MGIHNIFNKNKKYLEGKKAFIFDMDGTLIDSMQYWSRTAGEDIKKYPSQIEYLFDKYNTTIKPKENALEFLNVLHENGFAVGIASDTPRALSNGFFMRYDFDSVIDCYVGSDDVGVYKHQSSEIFLHTAKLLGAKPEECIIFEDNKTSVISAVNTGIDVVGVFDSINAENEEFIRSISVDYIYDMGEMFIK